MSTVKLTVIGRRGDRLRHTLAGWLQELKDFLLEELGVEVEVVEEDVDVETPALLVDGELLFIGMPSEEGYLIEALKKALRPSGETYRRS